MSSLHKRAPLPHHVLGNVQALRATAALLVVLVHASLPNVGIESFLSQRDTPWLLPFQYVGLFGVDLFFVISGFIMIATNWGHFGKRLASATFIAHRIIRIYPPYWFALLPVLPILLFARDRFMVAHVGVKTGILASILLIPSPQKPIIQVSWTLVFEMIFYVVFAVLLQFDRKYVVVALTTWFIVQVGLYFMLTNSSNFYLRFASQPLPIEFLFGTIVGLLYMIRFFPAPRMAAAIAIASVALACYYLNVSANQLKLVDTYHFGRLLIFGIPAMLVVYGAVALEVRGVFRAPRAIQSVGDGSYAIYLWHVSILVVLRQALAHLHLRGAFAHAATIAVTLAIITAFGLAVYRYFEKPVTSYLNRTLLGKNATRPFKFD